jgi:predicted ATP-binding protein involved in virulence
MSEVSQATRIEALRLTSYRRFENLEVAFDPDLTVLVSSNGGGKTAILDALAAMWAVFVGELLQEEQPGRLSRDDVRRIVSADGTMESARTAKVEARAAIAGSPVAWTEHILRSGQTAGTMSPTPDDLTTIGARLHQAVMEHAEGKRPSAVTLPLISSYGTGRLWNTKRARPSKKKERADTSRLSGYTDCLSPASSFRFFEGWFRRFSYEAQSAIASGRASPHRPGERLQAVRAAVGQVLAPSGWQEIEWDFAEDALVASHAHHGRLPVRMLSDGIRNMIGLVGDIAHRAARLNPHLGAAAASVTPGVVLIDEVDMHLHPEWQQTVVPSLRAAFPALQLIVTTHSHLVISTVSSRCIRILREDGSVSVPTAETEGYDSPFALGVVFGVHPRPPGEIGRKLTDYRALVEQGKGDSEEASALRESLRAHFGPGHPAMLEADGLRRLQAFKSRIGAGRGGG